jgi:hypothetical protein
MATTSAKNGPPKAIDAAMQPESTAETATCDALAATPTR